MKDIETGLMHKVVLVGSGGEDIYIPASKLLKLLKAMGIEIQRWGEKPKESFSL